MPSYLGQNFLINTQVQDYIVDTIKQLYKQHDCTTLIEIGPGKGALTQHLLHIPAQFFAIEKDTTLRNALHKACGKTDFVIREDVLQTDIFATHPIDPSKTCIVGNLPYYITSPILRQFFGTGNNSIPCGMFMMQKEVGDKLKSDANKKSYLWRLVNYAYDVKYCKTVPAVDFDPAPKVASCLVTLHRKEKTRQIDFKSLTHFLDIFAPYSRKTLHKIQKMTQAPYVIPASLHSQRLEQCSPEDLQTIIQSYHTN